MFIIVMGIWGGGEVTGRSDQNPGNSVPGLLMFSRLSYFRRLRRFFFGLRLPTAALA